MVSAEQPYGSWSSPLTAHDVTASSARFDGARFVGDDVWWSESIAAEGGRSAIRRRTAAGSVEEMLPAPWNARSRVHEYGGGAWTVDDAGVLYFVDAADQRVRALAAEGTPVELTAPLDGARYGGLTWQHGTLLAVREIETGHGVPIRSIVAIDTAGAGPEVLADGSDFLAQPALSPDRSTLAWVAWNHPDMPWDRTRILVRRLHGDQPPLQVAGATTAALQPTWIDNDTLLVTDEPSGRWNLSRIAIASNERQPITSLDADIGGGLWVLGTKWFAPLADGRIVAVCTNGADEVSVVDARTGDVRPLGLPISARASIEDVSGTRMLVSGAGPSTDVGIWLVDVDAPADAIAVAGAQTFAAPEWVPTPRAISVDGPHGEVFAYAYAPTNPTVDAPAHELPPYVVWVHGGPTSHVGPSASPKIAYFTSRGIGVLDVNYGGSTGYGRDYRERLRGQWGVVDVDDVVAAASGIAAAGIADPARLAIAGGSAGGWTVLSALVRSDVFGAGISRYGVGDARTLAADTHDFEARYLDGLIGPLDTSEQIYLERSPLTHAENFRVPILIPQGDEDRVVPPARAEAIRDALRERGVPHAYVLYEGEGHGFRRRETSIHALESELAFLGRVFHFDTPDVPPLALSD